MKLNLLCSFFNRRGFSFHLLRPLSWKNCSKACQIHVLGKRGYNPVLFAISTREELRKSLAIFGEKFPNPTAFRLGSILPLPLKECSGKIMRLRQTCGALLSQVAEHHQVTLGPHSCQGIVPLEAASFCLSLRNLQQGASVNSHPEKPGTYVG